MLHRKSRTAAAGRRQSRAEILKAHLDSLSPAELLQVRPDYYALRFGRGRNVVRKYDPNQPRDDHGRWTDADGGQPADEMDEANVAPDLPDSFSAARRRGRSPAFCMSQFTIDNLLCSTVEPASRRAVCRGQAAERLANCIAGRQIPPLSY